MSTTPSFGPRPLHHGTTVRSAHEALEVLHDGVHGPLQPEVLLMALDQHRRVLLILCVDNVRSRDDVIGVLEVMADLALDTATRAVVLASVRPGEPLVTDDVLIWWTLCDIGEEAGLEVLDWFVLTEEFLCDPFFGQSARRIAEGDDYAWP